MRSTASHPSIIRLLLGRCPATILWLIVAVIVSPIYGVSNARPLAHVGQKSGEVVFPRSTHPNAAPAVVFVIPAALVIASILHTLPDVVLDGPAFKVSAIRLPNSFQPKTTARENPFADVILTNSFGISADAFALPEPMPLCLTHHPDFNEPVNLWNVHFSKW